MVINLRGTGGSGKSTITRRVMEYYPQRLERKKDGRRQPLAYTLYRTDHDGINTADDIYQARPLFVPGHYETACGGCDTITSPDEVYDLVTNAAKAGYDVLYEGIIIGDDVTRAVELARLIGKENFRVIALNTPMDVCISSIQARRDARGDSRPLSKTNTISRNERLKRIMSRLKDASIDARWLSRDEALANVIESFELGGAATYGHEQRQSSN